MASESSFVEFEDVSFSYVGPKGATPALEGTSFEVARGQLAAVVGPSGCGKSTLTKLTSGLCVCDRGRVRVADKLVTRPLNNVGMAFQNSSLLPWRTTLDNVLLPLEIVQPHRARFRSHRSEYVERTRHLLGLVGLAEFADQYPWQLSGGMQQRASLCRALVHEPSLLMLDEPFAALDAFTKEELWEVLQELWLKTKPTVIFVTHDLREAVYLADQVLVMSSRPGRIMTNRRIDLPRPRTLDMTYEPEFVELTHELRETIRHAQSRPN